MDDVPAEYHFIKSNSNVAPDATVVASNAVVSVELDGERVLLNIDNGQYYGLNDLGSFIFELVREKPTVAEVIDHISESYAPEVSRRQVELDVLAFMEQMEAEALLSLEQPA